LVGDWELNDIGNERISRGLTLSFHRDGTVTGTVKCNTLGGRFDIRAQGVGFFDVIITTAGCGPGWPTIIDRADRALFSPAAASFLSVDSRHLYIVGSERLRFERTT